MAARCGNPGCGRGFSYFRPGKLCALHMGVSDVHLFLWLCHDCAAGLASDDEDIVLLTEAGAEMGTEADLIN